MARPFGRRRISWFGILYPAIGIVVAATHGYLVDWNIPRTPWKAWQRSCAGGACLSSELTCMA